LKFLLSIPEKLASKREKTLSSELCLILHAGNPPKDLINKQTSSDIFLNFLKPKEKDLEITKSMKSFFSTNFQAKFLVYFDKNLNILQEIVASNPPNFKSCEGKLINGPLIYKIAYEVTEFLKNGANINVSEVLEQAFSSEAKEILEDLKKDFQTKVKSELNDEASPYEIEEIEKIFKLGLHDFSMLLDNKLKGICDIERYIELRNEFQETSDKEFEAFIEFNKRKSKEFCEEILTKFFSTISIGEITSPEAIKPTLIREFEEEFNKLSEIYMNNARGPAKFQSLFDNLASFLFQKYQKVYEGLCNVFIQENNKTRLSLLQMKEERDKLLSSIKELESLRFEAEQMKENISRDAESLKREFDYKLLSKDYNEESLKNTLESKDKLIRKKKEQKKALKTVILLENFKKTGIFSKGKHEISRKRIEIKT